MNNIRDIIRTSGLRPLERVYNSESTTRAATRTMSGRTHYFDPDTLRYFNSSVSCMAITENGVAMVTLERVGMDSSGTRKGYRVNVHDLTGRVIGDRVELENMTTSKAVADRQFHDTWAAAQAREAEILRDAIDRETARLASALRDLKTARKMVKA